MDSVGVGVDEGDGLEEDLEISADIREAKSMMGDVWGYLKYVFERARFTRFDEGVVGN